MAIYIVRRLLLLALLSILLFFTGKTVFPAPGRFFRPVSSWQDPRCEAFPDPGNVVVAVKMNPHQVGLEQINRVANLFHCLSSDKLLLLADVDQTLGPYKIHSVTADAASVTSSWNPFSSAGDKHKYSKRGSGAPDLSNYIPSSEQEPGLHNMDKYRFILMVQNVWRLQPNMDWYIFPDAQGHYFWSNLIRWLREIDSSEPRFFGKASRIASSTLDIPNDWAGFVLSGAAVRALVTRPPSLTDRKLSAMESGQHVLATALHTELQLKLTDIWPLFIGEVLGRIPFKQEIWCEPVIGLSDVPSDVVQHLLQSEQILLQSDPSGIFTFKSLFHHLSDAYTTHTPHVFDGSGVVWLYQRLWDNIANSQQYEAEYLNFTDPKYVDDKNHFIHSLDDPNSTPEACARACDAFRHCIQFSYMEYDQRIRDSGQVLHSGGVCHLSKVYRFGLPREMNSWEDDAGNKTLAWGSVGNTQVWSSVWHRERWDRYSEGLRCH